jgi:hypothetical protein
MYSSTLPTTSALDGGGWSAPRPGRFTPGIGGWVGSQGRSGRVRKISPPPGFDPRTVQDRSEPLYRLSYLGPPSRTYTFAFL